MGRKANWAPRGPREPKPTAAELAAVARLSAGSGDGRDAVAVRKLVDRCGRYGCAVTKTSRSARGFDECPGWCDALEAHDRAERARADAIAGKGAAKPRALASRERAALRDLEGGEPLGAGALLAIELLCEACRLDGCPDAPGEGGEPAVPESGVPTCPGWCALAARAWEGWWAP